MNNFKVLPQYFPAGTEKNQANISHDSRPSVRESKADPPITKRIANYILSLSVMTENGTVFVDLLASYCSGLECSKKITKPSRKAAAPKTEIYWNRYLQNGTGH
jgi:hypothetical protein